MVESFDPSGFDKLLTGQWQKVSDSQKATESFLKDSMIKQLDEGNLVAFFNAKLDINRFFESSGDCDKKDDAPQVEFGAGG